MIRDPETWRRFEEEIVRRSVMTFAERLPDEVVSEAAEQTDIEGPQVDWKTKGHRVELVGREVGSGHEAYKPKVTLASGAVRREYLDVKTLYLVRSESTRVIRGRAVRITTTFGEFKKSKGLLFPRRIEIEAAGRPQKLLVIVDRIDVNPPLSDAHFELPAAPATP